MSIASSALSAAVKGVDEEVEGEKKTHSLDQEGLMGLRARLAFMEVPPEQEERWVKEWGHGLRAAVDALKVQLQVQERDSVDVIHLSHSSFRFATYRTRCGHTLRYQRHVGSEFSDELCFESPKSV